MDLTKTELFSNMSECGDVEEVKSAFGHMVDQAIAPDVMSFVHRLSSPTMTASFFIRSIRAFDFLLSPVPDSLCDMLYKALSHHDCNVYSLVEEYGENEMGLAISRQKGVRQTDGRWLDALLAKYGRDVCIYSEDEMEYLDPHHVTVAQWRDSFIVPISWKNLVSIRWIRYINRSGWQPEREDIVLKEEFPKLEAVQSCGGVLTKVTQPSVTYLKVNSTIDPHPFPNAEKDRDPYPCDYWTRTDEISRQDIPRHHEHIVILKHDPEITVEFQECIFFDRDYHPLRLDEAKRLLPNAKFVGCPYWPDTLMA